MVTSTEAKMKEIFESYTVNNKFKYLMSAGNGLKDILFEMEGFTYHEETISADTRGLIAYVTDPYIMVLLERSIKETYVEVDGKVADTTYFFKDKILNSVGYQLDMMMSLKYPYYSYENIHKQAVKFIGIRTGNDLFAPTAKNYDRDYTGSILFEVGTDFLNPLRRRPLKSYQTVLYGFDVWTPQFNDSTKFQNFDDYDSLDRPHGSFQYIGWSKKGLSKYNHLRWSTTIKMGKIGGNIGAQFQTALHQDVSYSLRPKGWDAQVSNGGRLGISLETKHEYQFRWNRSKTNPNGISNWYFSPFVELKVGSYMTNGTLGVQWSNKAFSQTNHNFINHRTRQNVNSRWDHFMYNVAFKSTYVVHNTMLEGYGVFQTSDQDPSKIDEFTPSSVYVLKNEQLNRLVHTGNVTLGYTTRYASFFYNWYIISPETNLGSLKTTNPNSSDLDLTNRWHHFAVIGVTFNVH